MTRGIIFAVKIHESCNPEDSKTKIESRASFTPDELCNCNLSRLYSLFFLKKSLKDSWERKMMVNMTLWRIHDSCSSGMGLFFLSLSCHSSCPFFTSSSSFVVLFPSPPTLFPSVPRILSLFFRSSSFDDSIVIECVGEEQEDWVNERRMNRHEREREKRDRKSLTRKRGKNTENPNDHQRRKGRNDYDHLTRIRRRWWRENQETEKEREAASKEQESRGRNHVFRKKRRNRESRKRWWRIRLQDGRRRRQRQQKTIYHNNCDD